MARPKSNDKRRAILDAATRVIVAQGLSAPTATIAREAGISTGSLFTYFETKTDLLNQLYLELKGEMTAAALAGFPEKAALRKQAAHVWSGWMNWAAAHPDKRRALAVLGVSDEITPQTRAATQKLIARPAALIEQLRSKGRLRDAPMSFVGPIITSLAETTMDVMISDPARAEEHCTAGFETFWRVLA